LEACKDPNRQFLPTLKEFFDEAIEQLDPANQVEKQYLCTNVSFNSIAFNKALNFKNLKTCLEY
jgi:hypothetical protein